jgi:hypothetical protein
MVLMILLRPLLEGYVGIKLLMDLFFSLVVLSGVFAVSQRSRILFMALAFAAPAFILQWLNHFMPFPYSFLTGKLFGIFFYSFLIVVILNYLFRETTITTDMLIGAICVYMLIGVMWASMFTILENLHPGSFRIPESPVGELSDFFYYSFVTLTTLGYGDITPITSIARSLSIIEALIGQLYIAILVSRLVGVHIAQVQNG